MQKIGTRAQVMHRNAIQTGGGLKRENLKYNKQGKIVSRRMSLIAQKEKRLQKTFIRKCFTQPLRRGGTIRVKTG